jgi:hypothetical protein
MATAKTNLGKMKCEACGDVVAVFESPNKTLSYKCQDAGCEHSAFAQGHTGAAARWRAKIDAAKAPAAPASAPAKTPAKAGFSLDKI